MVYELSDDFIVSADVARTWAFFSSAENLPKITPPWLHLVLYRLPFGVVGRAAHALIVRRQLLEIFRYRRTVIGDNLGWVRAVRREVEVRPAK